VIDTVTVQFPNGPAEDNLQYDWQISTHISIETGEIKEKYIRNVEPFKGTYYPIGYKGDPVFILELSLPKVLYGMNWPMLLDIQAAVAKADEMLAADPGWPRLRSVGEAEIVRLDACYNHSVGGDLDAYLQALSRSEFRSRQTVPFLGTGVEYRCASGKTKFYNKRAETNKYHPKEPHLWAPPGTLRQETTLRSSRGVAQATRAGGITTLNALTPEIVLDILWRDHKHLGIVGCQFATRDVALQVLCDHFGPNKGLRLYGALCAFQDRQKKRIARETSTQRHSIMRLFREARAAGIAPAMVEEKTLPPLEIKWPPSRDQVPEGYWPTAEEYQY
jgi:hypothetical protein